MHSEFRDLKGLTDINLQTIRGVEWVTWCYEIKSLNEVMNSKYFLLTKRGVMGSCPVTYVLRTMIWTCCQILNVLPKLVLVSELCVSINSSYLSIKAKWVLLPLKYDAR
jgi:hypothetical protein